MLGAAAAMLLASRCWKSGTAPFADVAVADAACFAACGALGDATCAGAGHFHATEDASFDRECTLTVAKGFMVMVATAAMARCDILFVVLNRGAAIGAAPHGPLLMALLLVGGPAAGACRLIHACCSMAVAEGRAPGCFCSACDISVVHAGQRHQQDQIPLRKSYSAFSSARVCKDLQPLC